MLRHRLPTVVPVLIGLSLVVAADVPRRDTAPAAPESDEGSVVVKFSDGARVRLRNGRLVSLAGTDTSGLDAVLAAFGDPPVGRLFTRPEAEIDRDLEAAERRSRRDLADLNGYYEIAVAPADRDELIRALGVLPIVQTAYPAPAASPPPGDVPPATPDFEPDQGYLNEAPGGIDAREAWTRPGGRGDGILVVDIEYDWRDMHEDLDSALGRKLCYTPKGSFIDHGTAVLGEIVGGDNGYGVTGIVPNATPGMVTQDPVGMSNSVARAIDCAASLMDPGDVMLLETQTIGPRGNYVPSEWNQAEFDAISAATAKGITVVEAAGNGNEDLDDPVFGGAFDRTVRDSGAIIVGAGAAPGASQPDRSKLSFSTYGSRVDVQGWGHMVTTTGYGGLFNGDGDPNQYYTATFNGTSSASPVVTGAAVALQGVQRARGGEPLDPLEVRRILSETGSPQQAGPYPGQIGPRPDLRRALNELAHLFVTGVQVNDALPLGNEDGILDPGETAVLRLTARNAGQQTATGVEGIIGSDDGVLRVTDHHADWPDLASATEAESLPPHHRLSLQPEASCGDRLRFRVGLTSNEYADDGAFDLEVGRVSETYSSLDVPLTVPKKSGSGVTSTLDVPDGFVVADVQAEVDITHADVGELVVVLRSPSGTAVTLHDHSGAGAADLKTTYDRETEPDGPGRMDDFNGEDPLGTWSLQVIDDVGGRTKAGALNAWSLELTATTAIDCSPLSCAEPVPAGVGDSLRLDPSGIEDIRFTWTALSGAAEYRIWMSESPGMEGAVLVGQTPETELLEAGGLADPAALVFYQVRAVNVCEWEGP